MPSSVIRRFAWRADPPALDVEFVSGGVYRYAGVPEEEARAMKGVLSKGSYFNRHIRDAYSCQALRRWPDSSAPPVIGWRSD